jgi:hypothetical protein
MTPFILSLALLACPPESTDPGQVIQLGAVSEPGPIVDLAICLDTSGSMSGLIDATKQKIWEIVNDLATAKPTPRLRVALLTFGNDGHLQENGWVNIDSAFTEDLDLISSKLFALTTNGGNEYVGRVVQSALTMQWTPGTDTLKLIVVAGNEAADQDPEVPFREMSKKAINAGVMVNSIYCGDPGDNLAPVWKEVSLLADGHFAAIDQNHGTIVVSTPFDEELATLGTAINATYIPYGSQGQRGQTCQTEQDANAAKMNASTVAARAASKGCSIYNNRHWDLVDACRQKDFKLEEVKAEELPEVMRPMTVEERRAYVNTQETARAEIQAKLTDLQAKRQAHIEEQLKSAAVDASKSFDTQLRKAIRAQAESKGLKFEAPKVAAEH